MGASLKLRYLFGAILEHKAEGTLRYYHTTPNHNADLDRPMLVCTAEDLRIVFEPADGMEIAKRAALQRPNPQGKVRVVTNVSFFLYWLSRAGRIRSTTTVALQDHIEKREVRRLCCARERIRHRLR